MGIPNLSAFRVMRVLALLIGMALPLACFGQNDTVQNPLPANDDLQPYTSCELGKDFQIVTVDNPITNFAWSAPTEAGDIDIPVETGVRMLVTYQDSEPFANVKVERFPKATYTQEKTNLLNSLEYLDSKPGMDPKVQTASKNGLTLYGISRNELKGAVLSIYNVFLDDRHVAIGMYLLNAEAADRKFKTIDEYKEIRDKFLDAYSKCVAGVNKPR